MKYENVCLESIGYELPSWVVTSAEIEERLSSLYERLGLQKGRLELMTGIRERRFWPTGTIPSDVATKAAKKAIEKAGIAKEKLGAIFHASVCRNYLEPATANVEHYALGLRKNTLVFDISNACLGVLNGMVTLANMIELGQVEAGIVVAGEMGETLVEPTIEALANDEQATRKSIKSAFASLTIGSGAVAVILTHKSISKFRHRLLGGVARCATEASGLCTSDTDSGFSSGAAPIMNTDSEGLLKAGCALAGDTFKLFTDKMGWSSSDIDRTFTHQVGSAHRKLLYESIGVDTKKDFATLDFLGNVGSVSLPITLALGEEKGVLSSGDRVGLLGIGSGLNCLMLGIEW